MFIAFLIISIIVGLIIGYVQTKQKAGIVRRETPTLTAQEVKIISVRKYGLNGFITFEDSWGNRFEVLAKHGIVPFSTYVVGDRGKLKHSQGELVEFIRDR